MDHRDATTTTPRRHAVIATAALAWLFAACAAAGAGVTVEPRPAATLGSAPGAGVVDPGAGVVDPGAGSAALMAQAALALQAHPADAAALLTLGLASYQHARETADPTDYARADEAFDRLLALDPDDAEALIGKGTVALARHDFVSALELGERARAVAPRVARVYGVIGDALIELGRYEAAIDAIQTMVDTRPDLGSYSRVSYVRELHGDLDGAIEVMEDAVRAGGANTENTEYVRTALGNLWLLAGDLDHAEASYLASLDRSPGYAFALVGSGRVAAARGDLGGSIDAFAAAAARVPFPEVLVALGEAQEAGGRAADAAGTYALVRDISALFSANGVSTDLDLALFEADHGDAPRALELARSAYAATPNVKAADALAWALYRSGQLDEARLRTEESLRLGSVEPSYRYHAGVIAAAQGDVEAARAWLSEGLAANPAWSPLHAPRAAEALRALPDAAAGTAR